MINDELITLSVGELQSKTSKRIYHCRFVKAGRILATGGQPSDIELTTGALNSAIEKGLFNDKACFVDHAGFFDNPSLRNLAGVTLNNEYNPGTNSIDGDIKLYNTTTGNLVGDLLDELLQDREHKEPTPNIGLSIVFWPVWAPRDNRDDPRRIVDIKYVESVDFVFEPAADGRVLEALSILTRNGGVKVTDELETSEQTNPAQNAGRKERRQDAASPASKIGEDANLANAQPVQLWIDAMADTAARTMIANSGLPEASREKLSAWKYDTPQAVQNAIDEERAFLAKLSEDHVVDIGGVAPRGGHIQMGMTSLERIEKAFEALMMGTRPPEGIQPLTGIRELYNLLSGDYEMTGLFNAERIQFANVNSSTMANMVANVLNKVVVQEFIEYPRWWERIVSQMDFATLQAIRWITLGGVGELPTVAEGAAYTELTWDDKYETSSFVKKGGYLGITIEAIDKDDTTRLRSAPRALAQAAWLTLSKAVSAIFTDNSGVGPTLIDTGALFNATAVSSTGGHANLGTTALSITTWDAARLAMRKQVEVNSGERLGALTAPRYLLVPPDLEITALQVLGSTHNYLYALSNGVAAPINPQDDGDAEMRLRLARERVIVVDLWTDANDWAAVADPRLYPTIGLGFRYGRQPEVFSVASPTAGLMFTNDTMPIKVRFFFAVGPVDFRGLYKANVS
jgi:hypothetical protein